MDTVTGVATDTWISDLGLALKHKSKENTANRKLPYPVSISEDGICPILSVQHAAQLKLFLDSTN